MKVPLESLEDTHEPLVRLHPKILHSMIGNLLLPQQISLFHGNERAPLSLLAHSIILAAARVEHAKCVFLDSGSNYSSYLIRSLCDSKKESVNLLERIIVGQVLQLDDVVEKIHMLHQMGNISLIVLDSLTGVLNLTGAPGSRGRQRILFSALDEIRRTNNSLGAHILITDHSSQNWISGDPTPIGGNVLSHAVDSVVLVDRLRQGEDLVRILIERSSIGLQTSGIILRVGSKGIRTIR